MRRKFFAAVERVRGLFQSAASDSDESALKSDANDGPDLYECSGCGAVFISRPSECSECEDDDFSNLGKFD